MNVQNGIRLFHLFGMVLVGALTGFGAPSVANADLPKLVDLGSKQCIPCKQMAPILDGLQKEYKDVFEVEFIDVWIKENADQAKVYGIKIIPTQIFLSPEGKELWRHEGFLSKEAILSAWTELGYEMRPKTAVFERWEPARPDRRSKSRICHLCDGDIDPKTLVVVKTPKGDVRLCGPHCYFIMYSALTQDTADFEKSVSMTDWHTGEPASATRAVYLRGLDEKTKRPTIRSFADREKALADRKISGGDVVAFDALKKMELAVRCGFCDRATYPQDAAEVRVGPGLHTWGCCAHCALGVAARTGMDIEVRQPDALTGETIVVKTRNGSVESLEPPTAVAWFGMKKKPDGQWVSAGCFHQGNFVNEENLRKWADLHPFETGRQITIEKALGDKMKLTKAQIEKACKIGECAPK